MFVDNFRDKMRRILCVVDLTESSQTVLEVATRIALAYGDYLIVLFPYRLIDAGYQGDVTSLKKKLEREAREKFAVLKNRIRDMSKITCEFQAEIGFIPDRIQAHVGRNNIDMVIVSQQQGDLANDSKGYDLQKLITTSKLPFVIVPAKAAVEAHA